jgi:hypothetical protein
MKLHTLAFAALVAGVGLSSVAQGQYPPSSPPPPPDSGYQNQGNYQDNQGYSNQGDDQGYDNQQPYYDPRPDGNYGDPYNDPNYSQAYSQDYGNQGPVDQSVFYSELSPYGRWIQRGSYGWVWEPTQVAVGWRPYTQGHWVDTDYGWTWVSSEPWGWATYHYGRWTLDSEYGWLWVPGSDWGPAWVSFQEGGGYVGWAPLPPSVGFQAGIGIQIGGLSLSASIDPYAYSFVPERSFLDERLEIEPPARNVTFIHQTRNITNITVSNNRVFNRSIDEQRIAQATGRPVHHYQIAESRNPAQGRVAQVQGDRVQIFRPAVELAKPRPDVTPAVAMQRRQQRVQQAQRVQPGQPAVQPGRQVQPGQQAPGRLAPDHAYDQANQPNQANGRRVFSPADMPRKHQAEQQQLQARQDAERSRLMQAQQQEQSARQGQQNQAAALQAQHQAEQQALQQQQQREQQMLQARHQREQQAAQSRPQQRPPERPNQQQQRQQQQQNRREQQQPPPPPPV